MSHSCRSCNEVCLPEEAPLGYYDQIYNCDLEDIWYLAKTASREAIKPDDKRRLLFLRLEYEDNGKEVFDNLGFRNESDCINHLEDISLMGLTGLYGRHFSGSGGVNYHQFMNFAKRAHVSDSFLKTLVLDSLASGKIQILKNPRLLRHFQIKLAILNRADVLKTALLQYGINQLPDNLLERICKFQGQGEHQISVITLRKLRDMGVNLNYKLSDGSNIADAFRRIGRETTAKNIEYART